MNSILSLLLVSFLILTVGCGTDTGNPSVPHKNSGMSGEDDFVPPMVDSIVYRGCGALRKCHSNSFVINECQNALMNNNPNMVESLGLNVDYYDDLKAVSEDVQKGELQYSPENANICKSKINQLDCSSEAVKEAYDFESENPFKYTFKIVPASCKNVFFETK